MALVVVQVPMDEECASDSPTRANDWSGEWRTLAGLWGVPAVAMLIAALLEPMLRAGIWSTMLAWMGVACVLNARRCSRTHCRFTGPFFLLMAALVIAHATGTLSLGADGWTLLGGTTIVGFAALWWGSERIWGAFFAATSKGRTLP